MMNKKMKNIYLFRAMPGSGKSTLINDYELQSNTLSLDTFRELLSGISLGLNGNIGIDQQYNDHVSILFKEALKKRMQEGAVIIIDNLNNKISDLNSYYILGTKYGYNVKVVNFDLKELDFYKQRNKQRSERKQLPLESIKSLYKSFSEVDLSLCHAEIISVADFTREINTPISDLCVDLNKYDKINHIGDIMGSNQPLDNFLLHYNKNEFYIFLGNYFDLGNSPDLVVETLKKISKEENVVFLRGNYDKKLGYFVNDLEVRDDNFNNITKDKLMKDKEFIKEFYYNNQIDYFVYKYMDKNVFVNNAGVSNLPVQPYLINSSVFVEGVGSKTFDISACFNKNAPSNWVQIHGYRNFKNDKNESGKREIFFIRI